jgi:hypothetical protein
MKRQLLSCLASWSGSRLRLPNSPLPAPWSVEEIGEALVVIDSAGQKLSYVYFKDESGTAIGRQASQQRRGAAHCIVAKSIGRHFDAAMRSNWLTRTPEIADLIVG